MAVVVSLNEKWMRLKLDKLKLDQVNLQNVLKVRETAGFTISVSESETDIDVEQRGDTAGLFSTAHLQRLRKRSDLYFGTLEEDAEGF